MHLIEDSCVISGGYQADETMVLRTNSHILPNNHQHHPLLHVHPMKDWQIILVVIITVSVVVTTIIIILSELQEMNLDIYESD